MKKKIVALALVICMLAIAIVGGTLAYFTDTKTVENTFTAGQVKIKLDEAKVKKDDAGNLVKDGDTRIATSEDVKTISQEYHLYPAMTVTKDPTITVGGSESAYVAAKVIINGDLSTLIPMDGVPGMIDINAVASGGLLTDTPALTDELDLEGPVFKTDKCYIYQVAEDSDTWTLYIFMEGAQAVGTEITLFDTLTIDKDWDNAEMAKIDNMSIKVEAYATQTNGFANCFKAMYTAFPTAFPFAPTNP